MPGNTIGREAKLSSSHRPGILVFTTIQQITAVTSMMIVALATASNFGPAIEKSVSNRNKLIRVNRRQLTAGLAADAATELGPEPPRRSAPAVGNIGMRPERGRARSGRPSVPYEH